jgi:PKD repeat protein
MTGITNQTLTPRCVIAAFAITLGPGGWSAAAQTTVTFSASPISGVSPLSVQFTSTGPVGSNIGSIVNFGDGTIGNLNPAPICATCNPRGTLGHTYATAGTYTATLMDSYNTTLGTVTVTVTSPTTRPTATVPSRE